MLPEIVLDIIVKGFEQEGEQLREPSATLLGEWLQTAVGLVKHHSVLLQQQKRPLPNTLWAGSAGNLWGATFSSVVRRSGGTVVAHDHGYGNAYFRPTYRECLEFPHCDVFVTYNQAQVQAVYGSIDPDLLMNTRLPRIRSAGTPSTVGPRGQRIRARRRPSRPSKKVMYVAPPYFGDRLNFNPALPDLVILDWQMRLFSKLQEWGVTLLHKPHPEGEVPPPEGLAEHFGHHTVTDLFERVLDQADLFLYDYPLSTTFPLALRTGLPVVLVDLGYAECVEEARPTFDRRCRVVPTISQSGRIEIEWADLREAICSEDPQVDMTFVQTYHSDLL